MAQLRYLSDGALAKLRADIDQNNDRYRAGDFMDLAEDPGWNIGLGVEYDDTLLHTIDLSVPRAVATIDKSNSRIVGKALEMLSPTLANEERIWTRLSHIEMLAYSRARWLGTQAGQDVSKLVKSHFFAPNQTRIRDDHAVSRLWWNYQIARTCSPNDPDSALDLILKSADIRSNFVERIWMTSRRSIAQQLLEMMKHVAWVTDAEANFRTFMRTLNRLGGGIVFEVLDPDDTKRFLEACLSLAQKEVAA